MTKKPRQHLRLIERLQRPQRFEPHPEVKQDEFRKCDASDCSNVVALWTRPKGYSGPVYCVLHVPLTEKNR